MFRCTECWLHLGIAALVQNLKGSRYPILTGARARSKNYGFLEQVIGARFILFKVRDGLGGLYEQMDYGAKVETTFRMAFKGGLILFSAEGGTMCVRSLHFDGHEQYRRNLDKARIIGRLGKLPAGVVIPADLNLVDGSSDHHRADGQQYDDCQLLQLTDILVGGFRSVLGTATNSAQAELSNSLLKLVDRWNEGPHRMRNSRWHKGFAISEGYIENDKWEFRAIEPNATTTQPGLFSE